MIRIVLTRLAAAAATLWAVSLLLFFGIDALPGDAAQELLGRTATPESLVLMRQQLGLNHPALERYQHWLAGFLHGDLGTSLASGSSVWSLIEPRIVNTLVLAGATVVLLVPLSVALGALAALRHDRALDHLASGTTLVLIAVPEFVVGAVLVAVFAVWQPVLPAVSIVDPERSLFSQLSILVLPVVTLLAAAAAQTIRMVRATLLDVLHSDYVELARMKGVPEKHVILSHALPNAMAPLVQVVALNIAWLLGGVVVVEAVFQFPGVGQALVSAVAGRDVPTVEALGMLVTTAYVGVNLLADLAVQLLNPRLRRSP